MAAILNDLQTVFIQNFLALYKYIIYNTKLHMLICCGTFITATKQIRKLYFVLPRGTHIFYKNTTFRLHKLLKCANNTNSSCTLFIGITLHLSVCEYRQTDSEIPTISQTTGTGALSQKAEVRRSYGSSGH